MTMNDQLQSTINNSHHVTPEEAFEKDCVVVPSDRYCSGPNCMAWRWNPGKNKHWIWASDLNGSEPPSHWIPLKTWEHNGRKAGEFIEGPTHGYCGMVQS